MLRPLSNPPNPWRSRHVEWLGEPPPAALQVYEERGRSILSENDSPDVGFRWGVNPYRGCFHACAYCYARPYHQYLDLGAGTDFDRKIVVKVNAPELLREAFQKKSWQGESVAFSGVTDCYQPLEASYELTRKCLEVCHDFQNPVGIVTKGVLVRRDADVLSSLAKKGLSRVFVSVPFADPEMARAIEPNVASPEKRLETVRILADAGIPVGVSLAPVIPGLNESQMVETLEKAAEAGARRAFYMILRLPREVLPVFDERIREALPLRAEKIFSAIRDIRGGKLNESAFGLRGKGLGPRYDMIEQLFETTCRRLGINQESGFEVPPAPFRRKGEQGRLFG